MPLVPWGAASPFVTAPQLTCVCTLYACVRPGEDPMEWAAGEKRSQWWRPRTSNVSTMFATGVRHVFTHLLLNSVAINFTFNKAHSALVTSDSAIAIAIDGIASVGPCLHTHTRTRSRTHTPFSQTFLAFKLQLTGY